MSQGFCSCRCSKCSHQKRLYISIGTYPTRNQICHRFIANINHFYSSFPCTEHKIAISVNHTTYWITQWNGLSYCLLCHADDVYCTRATWYSYCIILCIICNIERNAVQFDLKLGWTVFVDNTESTFQTSYCPSPRKVQPLLSLPFFIVWIKFKLISSIDPVYILGDTSCACTFFLRTMSMTVGLKSVQMSPNVLKLDENLSKPLSRWRYRRVSLKVSLDRSSYNNLTLSVAILSICCIARNDWKSDAYCLILAISDWNSLISCSFFRVV